MAVTIYMVSDKGMNFDSIIDEIVNSMSVSAVSQIKRSFDDIHIALISFEKFFLRTGSIASLTIMLSGTKEEIYADIVSSGAGNGIFSISWGADSSFANEAEKVLEKLGFETREKINSI